MANPSSPPYEVELAQQPDPGYLPALFYLFGALALPYFVWRASVINWEVWYGPVIYLTELLSGVTTCLFLWMTQKVYLPVHRVTALDRTVDVLIPTYNEPLSVLKPTVLGAMRIRGIRQVFILDDGNRRAVKAMARRLGVRYYGRTTNEHAKAGNMNNGLEHSRAEFVITLDADHIPMPHFVERTLGYFDDPRVAFVQTPQMFYNRECFLYRRSRGGWWSEQGMFYDVIQPAKNRWNAAFFVGTSAVLRRAALDSVGGFATGTATEDIHTSLRLHAKGWKSVFVSEPLAYGLEAENLKEFYRQRRRWAAGSLGLLLRSPDSPLWATGLTIGQRLNYLSATLAHLQGAQKLFYFLLPPLCALTLAKPVTANLVFALPVIALFLGSALLITSIYARGTYHLIHTEAYGLANAMAHVGGLSGVIRVQRKFAVSRKNIRCREHSWLNTILWLLLAIAVATIFRALVLMTPGSTGAESDLSDLMIAVFICTGINLLLLLSFLSYLLAYERSGAAPSHARLPAVAKHAYVEAMLAADRCAGRGPASVISGCRAAADGGAAERVKSRRPGPIFAGVGGTDGVGARQARPHAEHREKGDVRWGCAGTR